MEQDKQIQPMDDQDRHTIIENQTNNNCQQFFGPVSGCVFAMPGSTVTQMTESKPTSASSISLDDYIKVAFRDRRKDEYENMLSVIRQPNWSEKDHARFAWAIYQSDNMLPRMKPNTFTAWYKIFCDIFGFTFNPNNEPGKLTPNEATRQIEMYL